MGKTIEIKGKSYPMQFGYGAFRILGDFWNCKGPQGVAKKLQEIIDGGDDVSFDHADMLGDLVLAGIENAGGKEFPDKNEVVPELLFDQQKLEMVMLSFAESIPKGNPQPQKNLGKKAKRK